MPNKTIAELAISGKPVHFGHYAIIEAASQECDEVHLYVSLSDRARPGEVPILGTDMAKIWRDHIEKILPSNVVVKYGGSPVGNIWKDVGEANETNSPNTYVIYADHDDLTANFPEKLLLKYAGNLYNNGQIKLRQTKRYFSGTQMRKFLQIGDKSSFVQNLPQGVDGSAIWNLLYNTAKTKPKVKATARAKRVSTAEALIRQFISEMLRF